MAKRAPSHGVAPDGGWGWVVVFGSALAHFFCVGLGRSFGIFYTAIIEKFAVSSAAAAWTVSFYNAMRLGCGPVGGMLVDRFGCRLVVCCGGLLAAAGCVISSFSTTLTVTYIGFGLITGFGTAMVFAPSYIIVGQYFAKKKGKAMSLSTIGAGLGNVGLAPIISLTLAQYSYNGAMLIMGALMLHNCISGALYRPVKLKPDPKAEIEMQEINSTETHGKTPEADDEEKEAIGFSPEADSVSLMQSTQSINALGREKSSVEEAKLARIVKVKSFCSKNFSVLLNVTFVLYFLQICTMAICLQSFFTFLPDIALYHRIDKSRAALLLSVAGAADMGGRFITGFIFDLKPIRQRRRPFHSVLGIVMGLLSIVPAFCTTYVHFVIICVIWGLIEGGYHSQRATILSEFVKKDLASSAIGFVIASQGVGNLIGPPVGGYLRDVTGNYTASYIFCGMTLFCSCTLFLLDYVIRTWALPRCRRKQTLEEEETQPVAAGEDVEIQPASAEPNPENPKV